VSFSRSLKKTTVKTPLKSEPMRSDSMVFFCMNLYSCGFSGVPAVSSGRKADAEKTRLCGWKCFAQISNVIQIRNASEQVAQRTGS